MSAADFSEQVSAREAYAKLHANTFGPGHQGQTSQEAQAALDEIDRLRAHVKKLHQLNGYSKQRGWWCSCRQWHAGFRYVQGEMPPWNRTTEAIAAHHQHVLSMVCGPRTATSTTPPQMMTGIWPAAAEGRTHALDADAPTDPSASEVQP